MMRSLKPTVDKEKWVSETMGINRILALATNPEYLEQPCMM